MKTSETIRQLFYQALWYLYEEMEGRDPDMEEELEFTFSYQDVRRLEKEFDAAFRKLEASICR